MIEKKKKIKHHSAKHQWLLVEKSEDNSTLTIANQDGAVEFQGGGTLSGDFVEEVISLNNSVGITYYSSVNVGSLWNGAEIVSIDLTNLAGCNLTNTSTTTTFSDNSYLIFGYYGGINSPRFAYNTWTLWQDGDWRDSTTFSDGSVWNADTKILTINGTKQKVSGNMTTGDFVGTVNANLSGKVVDLAVSSSSIVTGGNANILPDSSTSYPTTKTITQYDNPNNWISFTRDENLNNSMLIAWHNNYYQFQTYFPNIDYFNANSDKSTALSYNSSTGILTLTTNRGNLSTTISTTATKFDDFVGYTTESGGTAICKNNHTNDAYIWGISLSTSDIVMITGTYNSSVNLTLYELSSIDASKSIFLTSSTSADNIYNDSYKIFSWNDNTVNQVISTDSSVSIIKDEGTVNLSISSYVANHHQNYYSHNIVFQDIAGEVSVRIQNTVSSIPTYDNIVNFLSSNGFMNAENIFTASGYLTIDSETVVIAGVYANNGTVYATSGTASAGLANVMTDKVVLIGGGVEVNIIKVWVGKKI